jgi:hypothetical protein
LYYLRPGHHHQETDQPIAANTTTQGADLAYLQQSHRYVNAESRKDSADRR